MFSPLSVAPTPSRSAVIELARKIICFAKSTQLTLNRFCRVCSFVNVDALTEAERSCVGKLSIISNIGQRRPRKSELLLLGALSILGLSLYTTPDAHAVPGSWSTGAAIPVAVEGYGATTLRAIHYYLGGYHFGDTDLNQRYSSLTNTWLPNGAPLPLPESELAAVTDGGISCSGGPCIYAVSGRTFPGVLQRYDPVLDSWTLLADMPAPVATEHSVVSVAGKIYVAGGRTSGAPGSGAVNSLQIYDIPSNTWNFGPPLPIAVSDAAAILQDSQIFVFGGFTSSGAILSTTQVFNIVTNTWTIAAPMPTARADESVGVCGSQLHVIGGETGAFTGVHEVYDPASNTWSTDIGIPGGASGSGTEVQAISDSSKIYIVGGGIFGSGSSNPTQNIWTCAMAIFLASTDTSVSCAPSIIAVYQITQCTAFVTDDSAAPTTPTGTVIFSSNKPGAFAPSSAACTLRAISSTTGSCSVLYRPNPGSESVHTIAATYSGDSTHQGSTGYTTISVTKRSSSTSVSCSPSTTENSHPTNCIVVVTDTSPGTPIVPSGTVAWSTSGSGVFNSTTCALVGTSSSTASCSVVYTPDPGKPRLETITGTYSGDRDHSGSSGSATVNVL